MNSGTLQPCSLCGDPIKPFGAMRHRFTVEALGDQEICLKCARRVTPDQVAIAENMERQWDDQSDS